MQDSLACMGTQDYLCSSVVCRNQHTLALHSSEEKRSMQGTNVCVYSPSVKPSSRSWSACEKQLSDLLIPTPEHPISVRSACMLSWACSASRASNLASLFASCFEKISIERTDEHTKSCDSELESPTRDLPHWMCNVRFRNSIPPSARCTSCGWM